MRLKQFPFLAFLCILFFLANKQLFLGNLLLSSHPESANGYLAL